VVKFTVDGKQFHTFIIRSVKNLLRMVLVHRDLNSLYTHVLLTSKQIIISKKNHLT